MVPLCEAVGLLLFVTVAHCRRVGARHVSEPSTTCHEACTIAWLREQDRSEDPEARRSARYLLRVHGHSYGHDSSRWSPRPQLRWQRDHPTNLSAAAARAVVMAELPTAAPNHNKAARPEWENARYRRAGEQYHRVRSSQAQPGAINDGLALREAIVPSSTVRREQWLSAVHWPAGLNSNPCSNESTPDYWTGCNCQLGRVVGLSFRGESLPKYKLQPAIAKLSQLSSLCAVEFSLVFCAHDANLLWQLACGRDLSGSSLCGTIPTEVSELTKLSSLWVTGFGSSLLVCACLF
jgi:hypothetical protein